MTLMCHEHSQSPTHKGTVLQGRKSSVNNNNNTSNNNINQQQNANNHNRRNSCSPPLSKNLCNNESLNAKQQHVNNLRLERSISEPAVEKKQLSQQQQQQTTNSSRYKTELCRPFEENGTCKYGDKCQFAHGEKELRSMARHPKYKTELCRTFHSTGLCPYGPRCHFIHNSEQTKKSVMTNLTYSRPKPLTSLGSAGDLSPPSSHGGSPTGTKSFDFQGPLSPPLTQLQFPDLAAMLLQKFHGSNFLENGFDLYDNLYEKLENNDNYIPHGNLELDIYSTAPVTPSTPSDTSYNFLPYF